MMLDAFWLSQAFIAVAGCFYLASFQFKDRKRVLSCIVLGAYCISVHFFLLKRPTAGALSFVSGTRVMTSYFTSDRRLMVLFMIAACVSFTVTYESPLSFLLLGSSLLATWAVFRGSDRTIRLCYMLSTSMWLIHNIVIGTPGGSVLEAVFLTSNIVGYYRHYVRKALPCGSNG